MSRSAEQSEGEAEPVLSEAEGKNLVLGRQAFLYANNAILRLRGVYPERSEGLRLRMTGYQNQCGGVIVRPTSRHLEVVLLTHLHTTSLS